MPSSLSTDGPGTPGTSRPRSHRGAGADLEGRSEFERDADRLLYASAFRRLSGVTQVTSPPNQTVQHDRLTHSLKVAQVGRRLAQRLQQRGVDVEPEVVYTAALAHDLGHPPFGHAAEQELQLILTGKITAAGSTRKNPTPILEDSFEGNAQSFRIVARTAARRQSERGVGLNLTFRSLAALAKYPWSRGNGPGQFEAYSSDKWGAYQPQRGLLNRALQISRDEGRFGSYRPLEAQLMDWADDVSYAVHDNEDYFRSGEVPLDRLRGDQALWDAIVAFVRTRVVPKLSTLDEGREIPAAQFDDLLESVSSSIRRTLPPSPYAGGRDTREQLHVFGSSAIDTLLQGVTVEDGDLRVPVRSRIYVEFLKMLTRFYVIERPGLAFVQVGQRALTRHLYFTLSSLAESADAANSADRTLPARFGDYLEAAFDDVYGDRDGDIDDQARVARATVDFICSLTDAQALALSRQFDGDIDYGRLQLGSL